MQTLAKAPGLGAELRRRLLDFATTFATLELDKVAAETIMLAAQRRTPTMLDLRQSGYAKLLLWEGEVKGEAKGKAEAILAILEARRVPLSDATRMKLLMCRDLELLQPWLLMAIGGHDAELRQQVEARTEQAA